MLVAQDKSGNLINLINFSENLPSQGQYFCPACKSPVILKNGSIKIPHFAHRSLQDCQTWSENESAQHLALKMALYQWFSQDKQKVELEKYLPALNQTPDLLVNDKIAIEVQCSHLSLTRLAERTQNYQAHGYHVIWLMGKDLWLKKSMTTLQKNLMYFSENRGFYYWELDLAQQKLRLKSLLHENLQAELTHQTQEFPFYQNPLLDLLRLPFTTQKLQTLPVPKQTTNPTYFIQKQLYHRNPKWLKLQAKYYQKGQNLLTLNHLDSTNTIAPIGLNLLETQLENQVTPDQLPTYTQISQSVLLNYYQNYYHFFKNNAPKKLYPPRYYDLKNKNPKSFSKKT